MRTRMQSRSRKGTPGTGSAREPKEEERRANELTQIEEPRGQEVARARKAADWGSGWVLVAGRAPGSSVFQAILNSSTVSSLPPLLPV